MEYLALLGFVPFLIFLFLIWRQNKRTFWIGLAMAVGAFVAFYAVVGGLFYGILGIIQIIN